MAENFKDWLTALLKAKDLTYEQLGDQIGVSHGAVGGWVRGKYTPDVPSVIQLAKYANENPYKLLNMVYGLPLPDSEANTNEQIERIMRKAEALPESVQEQLEAYIDFLLARGRKQNAESDKEKADAAHRK